MGTLEQSLRQAMIPPDLTMPFNSVSLATGSGKGPHYSIRVNNIK